MASWFRKRGRKGAPPAGTPVTGLTRDTPEALGAGEAPQHAVFSMSLGWTGGMGEAVFVPGTTDILRQGDLPVYVDGKGSETVRERIEWPRRMSGSPVVKVSALVRLEKKSGTNWTIPGGQRQTYRRLLIDTIHDVLPLFDDPAD